MTRLKIIFSLYLSKLVLVSIFLGVLTSCNNKLEDEEPRVGVTATPSIISFVGIESSGEAFVRITNYELDTVIIKGISSTDPGYSIVDIAVNDTIAPLNFVSAIVRLNYAFFQGSDTAKIILKIDGSPNTDSLIIKVRGPRKAVSKNLSNNSFIEKPYDFSPIDSRILFESNRSGNQEVYTMTLNADSIKKINSDLGNFSAVKYSRDGSKILYYSFKADTTTTIYLYDIASEQSEVILTLQGYNIPVDISPNGLKIVFNKRIGTLFDVYVIDVDTKEIITLADDPLRDEQGVFFEPSNQRVLYMAIDNLKYQMYKVRVTGEDTRKISDGLGDDIPVATTSDGSLITFYTDRQNQREVMICDWEGNELIKTTNNLRYDYPADINGTINRVLFMSSINGNLELFESGYRGEVELRLSNSSFDDRGVKYSKEGKYVLSYRDQPKSQIYLIDLRTYR